MRSIMLSVIWVIAMSSVGIAESPSTYEEGEANTDIVELRRVDHI